MSQFPQHKFHMNTWRDGPGTRMTSFSIIKYTTYLNDKIAKEVAEALERLQSDDFGDQIKIPYFEFQLDGCDLTYQAEYIKGRAIWKEYMPILKEGLLERENPWTIGDFAPYNFVVDTYHPGIHDGTAPIYPIDLDSYGYFPTREQRVQRWNEKMERRGWMDLLIDEDPA